MGQTRMHENQLDHAAAGVGFAGGTGGILAHLLDLGTLVQISSLILIWISIAWYVYRFYKEFKK